jgi:hypothetical protein
MWPIISDKFFTLNTIPQSISKHINSFSWINIAILIYYWYDRILNLDFSDCVIKNTIISWEQVNIFWNVLRHCIFYYHWKLSVILKICDFEYRQKVVRWQTYFLHWVGLPTRMPTFATNFTLEVYFSLFYPTITETIKFQFLRRHFQSLRKRDSLWVNLNWSGKK